MDWPGPAGDPAAMHEAIEEVAPEQARSGGIAALRARRAVFGRCAAAVPERSSLFAAGRKIAHRRVPLLGLGHERFARSAGFSHLHQLRFLGDK